MSYDVIYIDPEGEETAVAHHLDDRADAADLARRTAVERRAGRMLLPGSSRPSNCVCVVPADTRPAA